MKERQERGLGAFLGAPGPAKPTAQPSRPRNACKGCGKAALVPGGYCTPACAKKHDPIQRAISQGPNLMGPCVDCRKPWGALHYVNGKPAYYHIKSQGGCDGVEEWIRRMGFGATGG